MKSKDKVRELFQKAITILRAEGPIPLLKRTYLFIWPYIFRFETYYLYEIHLQERNEADCLPQIKDITFKIVSSTEQADELEADDFKFISLFPGARLKLDAGIIAACIFVERQIANVHWIAMNKEAKMGWDPIPYKVNFSNKEACTVGAYTLPEYRRTGLHRYNTIKRNQFLRESGIEIIRNAIRKNNAHANISGKIYAKAYYGRILGLKYYKEIKIT